MVRQRRIETMLFRQEEKSWLRKKKLRVCCFVKKRRVGYAKKNQEYAVSSGREELVAQRRIKSMLFR